MAPSPVQPCTLPAFFLSLFSCSSSFLFFPFPFCCRRTPLVQKPAAHSFQRWQQRGKGKKRSAPAAKLDALLCPQREPTKGVRRQQKGSKKARRAGRDRAALKTVPCRCLSAFPGSFAHSEKRPLKRDVRHPAAAEQAAGALLWFVLAAAKRVRPPSALDAKLFLLVAPWGPIAFYFLYRIQK